MTLAEWLKITDWRAMYQTLHRPCLKGQISPRKQACFCIACWRHVWQELAWPSPWHDLVRQAVEIAEHFVAGRCGAEDWSAAIRRADDAVPAMKPPPDLFPNSLMDMMVSIALRMAMRSKSRGEGQAGIDAAVAREYARQGGLFREIFADFFVPAGAARTWLLWDGGALARIARSIHDASRFEDLPILADALEEAGCTDPVFLDHCRGPGPHVRGCWVVDLLAREA
jgi:hypothetical protein